MLLDSNSKSHTRLDFRHTLSPRVHFPSSSWHSSLKSHWPQPSIKFSNPVIQLFMLPHVWPGWGHVYTEKSCPGCKGYSPTGATLPGERYKTWRMVIHEKQKVGSVRRVDRLAGPPFCDGTVGLRSSRPKVISPEVVSPETRVTSPEIFIHSRRPQFYFAQQHLCMTFFTGTVISLIAGPILLHNINTLAGPAGLTWESNLSHMLAWQTARRLPHIKKWRIQKKILHLNILPWNSCW